MESSQFNRNIRQTSLRSLNNQGANALLASVLVFLTENKITQKSIAEFLLDFSRPRRGRRNSNKYTQIVQTYEAMGVIMATWFSDPRFLNAAGNPLALSRKSGKNSVESLVRASRARVSPSVALDFMAQSPSIKFARDGTVIALRRVFVLPELEVLRAAFVVERFLETLRQNASARRKKTLMLLERSCHASEINLANIAPTLRDIENRGSAFMDAIDGEIEDRRLRRSKAVNVGELGVLVFAWTKPKSHSRLSTGRNVRKSPFTIE